MIKLLEFLHIYTACGCDACRWEAIDLKYCYWFKDWDVENPSWKFYWWSK